MVYNKVSKNWNENDCYNELNKLLKEGFRRLDKEKFDQSAQCFIEIGKIIRSIPQVRKRIKSLELLEKRRKRELKRKGIVIEEEIK